ncbi:MAG: class I SAM-dependent methyltransferase [Planctomycetes bacterium]|nr:class I SAM-dependent methyltransferase [Planctomycetota bacterium]
MQGLDRRQEEERLWLGSLEEAIKLAPAFVARYRFAAPHMAGKKVCDIACGAGYGSFFLSQSAEHVTGMDASEEAVNWACGHFERPNLRYTHVKGDEPWPVDQVFDRVTSFETLEHTHSPEAFLQSISDHLATDGLMVMSIPNGPKDRARNNPFHLHYFTQEQFVALLKPHFSSVTCFSQAYVKDLRHYLTKPLRKLCKSDSHRAENYEFVSGLREDAKNWLVVARKQNG